MSQIISRIMKSNLIIVLWLQEPTCYEEAKGCPEWEADMQEEIDTLKINETWELVNVTNTKIFKPTSHANGFIN